MTPRPQPKPQPQAPQPLGTCQTYGIAPGTTYALGIDADMHGGELGLLGIAHVVSEALFVGALGEVERRVLRA